MRTSGKQLLLIAGGVTLTALLYLAPQKVQKKNDKPDSFPGNSQITFEGINKEAKGQLKRQEAEQINVVESALSKDPSSVELNDSIGRMWDRLNQPQVSAHYFEKSAEKSNTETEWISAAYRFYDASHLTNDSISKKYYTDKAVRSYQNVLKINPDNLDAKTDLALCYAEGPAPMQGILLLREVVAKNPQHEMAQYNLGILSVKSGQYDKAISRFETVLQINPKNTEARFLLGRTYATTGKKELALKNLEMIKGSKDPRLNEQVNILINQINNH
jgi:tetratricopeptide (TPR) repeat protein